MAFDEARVNPLYGPYRKLARAKEHFDALSKEIAGFTDRQPYSWWTEYEDYLDDVREYTVFAEINEEPDIGWGLIAGDVIQNLRASLDQLVWGISKRELRDHLTAFPIELKSPRFEATAPKRIRGVSEPARALIEASQPYHWQEGAQEHPLAILKQLSNRDKHRTLLPVAFARNHEYVVSRGEWEVSEFTYIARGPIEEGGEVMRFTTVGEPPEKVSMDPYLSFEIAIEGRTLRDFESIFRFIGTSVLDAFDRS